MPARWRAAAAASKSSADANSAAPSSSAFARWRRRAPAHGRLHAGGAAVPRSRRRKRRRAELRQSARNRRLVRRGGQGGTEDGGAGGGRRRADAGSRLSFTSRARASFSSMAATSGAIEAANLLKEHLDVTVLIRAADDLTPPRTTDFPIVKGTIRAAKGHLGAFEIVVDDYAVPLPSSRARARVRARRVTARCRVATSCSTSPAARRCFPAADCATAICAPIPAIPPPCSRRCLRARDLVGSFDKPRYVDFTADLCAHSRSQHRRLPPLPRSLSDRAPSRRPAIMWRSTTRSAPAAANAPPPVRPARPAMRCRPPTR